MARPKIHDDRLRLRLLDEGGRLLASEGPAALTVRRLATLAGTSPAAIYGLFGDKWGLVEEMLHEGFRRFRARIDLVERTADPLADLRALGNAYRENALANPHLYDLMFGHPFPQFEPGERVQRFAMEAFEALVKAVQRCMDAGDFEGDTMAIASILFSDTHGLASLELAGWLGSREDAALLWEQDLTARLYGLLTPAGRAAASRQSLAGRGMDSPPGAADAVVPPEVLRTP